MKKIVPIIGIVALAGLLAVVVYYATRSTRPIDPPVDGGYVPENPTFKIEDFMFNFDHDADGKVTFEEFNERYGKGEPPLVFTEGDGAEPLSAPNAFKKWDRNRNGFIDADDIRLLQDKEFLGDAAEIKRRGLEPIQWKDKLYGMNQHQVRTFEAETGALARGELPFAGTFWKPSHLEGRWSLVRDAEGEFFGYVSERNGRLFILTEKAELTVKDPAKVEVSSKPADDPHMLYAAAIKDVPFDVPVKNLELARKCKEWGLKVEAGMLYARVLVFDPTNKEALDELGYRLEGEKFVSKGE
jgi:hypothetical protein